MILQNFITKPKTLLLTLLTAMLMFATSCGDSGKNIKIPGVDGPRVDLFQDTVLISMVLENVQVDGGLRYKVPKYNNTYVEIGPDFQTGGTLLAFSISLDDVFGDFGRLLDPQTLPGGRALPGVLGGSLPAVAFTIEKFHNLTIYIGPKVFGVFVPMKLSMAGTMANFRYYIGTKAAGILSLVGEDENGENSGLLLLINMNNTEAKYLSKVAKKY